MGPLSAWPVIATEFGVAPPVGGGLFGAAPPEPPPPQPEIVMAIARNAPATKLVEDRCVNKLLVFMVFIPEHAL
jgi:hypothetical protein